jgi:hypothetical protein
MKVNKEKIHINQRDFFLIERELSLLASIAWQVLDLKEVDSKL